MTTKLSELTYKFNPLFGAQALQASDESLQIGAPLFDGADYTSEIDVLLASLATGSPDVMAQRQGFGAAIAEPIQQIVPYVEQYDRFFMQQTIGDLEDNLISIEDLTNVAYQSHPRAEILYSEAGYRFTRPTFSTFQTGFKIAWPTLRKAGWNVLARKMNYVAWELAKKRDTAAKAVVDAAVPTNHKLSVSGGLSKASVDEVIRRSAQIGFPVKFAVINPGRLMEMQGWNWVMPHIPDGVSQQLIDNLYYANYAGVSWYAHPYAQMNTVYLAGDPSQIGWHQRKGSPRTDTFVEITQGEDQYAYRDAEHAWHIQSGLALWTVTII